jgi:CRISPR-associated protein Cas5t
MLCLYVEAPFAACRTFTAGWYRPTAPFLTPSAAYGLVLNVAGIESRLWEDEAGHDGKTPATFTRPDLPAVRIALGVPVGAGSDDPYPRVQTVYQQLHNYPVGKDAGVPEEWAKGRKNNITPVRREFLSGLKALVCVDGSSELQDRVRAGLAGGFNRTRYGLPFLGDNQFLPDRLEELPLPQPAYWYERVDEAAGGGPRPRTTRLTIWIDRADMARTASAVYAPLDEPATAIPERAWTEVRAPPDPPLQVSEGRTNP